MINIPESNTSNKIYDKFDATSLTAGLGLKQKAVAEMTDNEDFRKIVIGFLTIYESDHWIFIEKVYIPKNLLSHAYVYSTGWVDSARLYLMNGSYISMNFSSKYEKTLKRMAPFLFITRTNRMDSLDPFDLQDELMAKLTENNLTMIDAVIQRPAFFDEFAKSTVKKSEEAFANSIEHKSKISKFLLNKLS